MQLFNDWLPGEPDVKEFNTDTVKLSPISNATIDKCTSNPKFTCTVTGTQCSDRETVPITVGSPTPINAGQPITVTTSLFADFDLIKETTEEASPACMAILGMRLSNDVPTSGVVDAEYNVCSVLFSEYEDYGKWFDLKCNQRTRAQICTLRGKYVTK